MSDQPMILHLEIPPEVSQQDVWSIEEQIGKIAGVTVDLQEPKNLISATFLFIHVAGPYFGQAATVAGDIKAIHDLAKILYDFLHPAKQEKDHQQGKNKVVIIKKGKRIELYNLSTQEIALVLQEK